jgi:3-isopropylmalate dehydrogenase
MATQKLLLLPGDGIGPEVMTEVEKLITWMNKTGIGSFETERDLVGGSAYDAHKVAITDAAMKLAHESDAVVFGAVGGPKWDKVPYEARPEAGLACAKSLNSSPICVPRFAIPRLLTLRL